ncbi:meteorin-like protein [Styela clava]
MDYIQATLFLLLLNTVAGRQVSNSCDWKKSGLIHSKASREVEEVQLNCESGNLEWIYPTTALHIQFQYPHSTTDFTACFLPNVDFSGASLIHQGQRPPPGDSIFGQPTGLHVIYGDPEDKNKVPENTEHDIREIACVNSTYGKLKMLLMATTTRSDISRKVASFKYELYPISYHNDRPNHKKHRKGTVNERRMLFSGKIQDCRPCSNEELLHLYCSADFVARGQVVSVSNEENHRWTNLEFLSNHVIKETPSDWSPFLSPLRVPGLNISRITSKTNGLDDLLYGVFRVPAQCGFRPPQKDHDHTVKEYVIMGNYNFGGGWVECFPTYNYLLSIVKDFFEANRFSRKHHHPNNCNFDDLLKIASP